LDIEAISFQLSAISELPTESWWLIADGTAWEMLGFIGFVRFTIPE
jgi:hypothetical protein